MRAIEEGVSVDEAKDRFLAKLNERNQRVVDGSRPIRLSEKESRSFSFLKLIHAWASPEDPGARRAAAFELEACAVAGANRADQKKKK